jgi:hypothetical protein
MQEARETLNQGRANSGQFVPKSPVSSTGSPPMRQPPLVQRRRSGGTLNTGLPLLRARKSGAIVAIRRPGAISPRRRKGFATCRSQCAAGVRQLVCSASDVSSVYGGIYWRVCGFTSRANDDQMDAWSQGAKRLLRIKAKPPAPDPRLYYTSIGTSDQSWMI